LPIIVGIIIDCEESSVTIAERNDRISPTIARCHLSRINYSTSGSSWRRLPSVLPASARVTYAFVLYCCRPAVVYRRPSVSIACDFTSTAFISAKLPMRSMQRCLPVKTPPSMPKRPQDKTAQEKSQVSSVADEPARRAALRALYCRQRWSITVIN